MARKLLRNFGLNLLKLFLVGDLLYLSINGVNYFAKKTTPIRTQIELESMLKTERERLDIAGAIVINAKIENSRTGTSYSGLIPGSQDYEIVIDSNQAYLGILRHELYHVKNHVRRNFNGLRFFLIEEPEAALYGAFRIKI